MLCTFVADVADAADVADVASNMWSRTRSWALLLLHGDRLRQVCFGSQIFRAIFNSLQKPFSRGSVCSRRPLVSVAVRLVERKCPRVAGESGPESPASIAIQLYSHIEVRSRSPKQTVEPPNEGVA